MPALSTRHPRARPLEGSEDVETSARPVLPGVLATQWQEELHGEFSFLKESRRLEARRVGSGSETYGPPEEARSTASGGAARLTECFLPPVQPIPRPSVSRRRFGLLQQWEGTVETVSRTEFAARLRDLTDRTRPDEQATFDREEVSPDDLELLQPGAVFFWAIGYETSESGQRSRVSRLRFRRLPRWTKRDLARVREAAQRWEDLFAPGR